MRRPHTLRLLAPLTLLACACSPPVGPAGASDCAPEAAAAGPVAARLEPDTPLEAALPVVRFHLAPAAGDPPLEPTSFVLVEGEVGSAQLGQLARDDISQALSERLLPVLSWPEGDGGAVVAPSTRLDAGGTYTVASGSPRTAIAIRVAEEELPPLLTLVWPPQGRGLGQRVAVWCGQQRDTWVGVPTPALLMPTGEPGDLLAGVSAGGLGTGCVHFAPAGRASSSPAVPPPALMAPDGAVAALLEPTALLTEQAPLPMATLSCTPPEVPVGPGCALVADDRMLLRAPEVPLLWTLAAGPVGQGSELIFASDGSEQALLAPLPADSQVTLQVGLVDLAGGASQSSVLVETLPAMPHVVINEVLANAVGPEPEQEWLELYNDGAVSAALEGYRLIDIGGETPLPAAELPPGAFALVVNEDYDASSAYDVQPAPDTMLLRVESLGKSGLNNQGEPLELHDTDGQVVSRFPAAPKPKAGVSIMRTAPAAPDANPSSFIRCPDEPTPGAANET